MRAYRQGRLRTAHASLIGWAIVTAKELCLDISRSEPIFPTRTSFGGQLVTVLNETVMNVFLEFIVVILAVQLKLRKDGLIEALVQ